MFTGAAVVAVSSSVAFAAMLLSIVLWMEGAWGWSPLRAGLAIAPGPLMVPVVSFLVVGPLMRRCGAALVIALGGATFACGMVWWALAMPVAASEVPAALGGMVLTGLGVGLTLPTLMGVAGAALPPQAFATGSAVINMVRQTGMALGVAGLIAVVGTGARPTAAALADFRHAWWLAAVVSLLGLLPALPLLRRRRAATSSTSAAVQR
jgi:MFS family permease